MQGGNVKRKIKSLEPKLYLHLTTKDIINMTEKYEKCTKYSKHSINKSRKRGRDDTKYLSESRTPPLPIRYGCSTEDLIKQRKFIKEELRNIEKDKIKHVNKKCEKETKSLIPPKPGQVNDAECIVIKNQIENNTFKPFKNDSPEYIQDYNQLDSEDEENIIEQRRVQRKQLLEQLRATKSNISIKVDQIISHSNQTAINKIEINGEAEIDLYETKTSQKVSDMFSDDFIPKTGLEDVTQDDAGINSQLADNWDDIEGYYNIKIGDLINNNRYTIKSLLGQGVYANVVKAQDSTKENYEVAIKIIRNNDLMYKTGLKEIKTLKEVNDADPNNKYHCVRMLTNFMHKGHLCLVFEVLHMDLRSVLKKYGKNHGLNMKALMSYSRQLLLALRLLMKIGIIHADIKPDNILVNEKKNILKLCDFGSAMKINDNEPTPYLVSRFYRAPEIILGISYKHSVDVWSTACTMYEMATGKILFTGCSNNSMLKCFMDLKGRIPSRVIRKGKFKDQHFNYNNNFLLHKKDELTGTEKVVEVNNIVVTRDLNKELKKSHVNASNCDMKKITQFKDLLDKMLILDERQRFSSTDCLKHPFIQDGLQK